MNLNATLFAQMITFALFVWFCMRYVWPPIIHAIEKRQQEIAGALSHLDQAKKQLSAVHTETEVMLNNARQQAQIIIDNANKHKAQVVEEAKREALQAHDKLIEQAQLEMQMEHQRLRKKIQQHISELALLGAEKILQRNLDAAANQDIIDQMTTDL